MFASLTGTGPVASGVNCAGCTGALCIGGDFNCSFADNYYFTNWSRQEILRTFADCDMDILTATQPECIDHIAISRSFSRAAAAAVEEWNIDKKLSDHKGICIEF